MTTKVLDFCERYSLLSNGDTVVIALSGGADSTALLHILYSIKEQYNLTLLAAHLHHGIRGEEADRDERFCKILCEKYNLPLTIRRRDIPSLAKTQHIGEELCGREERYAFFGEIADARCAKIATAHHADDNAETLLLHLTRGSSLRGAVGILPRRDRIIRPLLCCTRDELEAYCAENSLEYVNDSTNADDTYSRNRLRHHVMPALRELNPSVAAAMLRFSQTAAEVSDYLDAQATDVLRAAKTDCGYSAATLLRQHPAVLKAALNILIKKNNYSAELRHLELLTLILRQGGAVSLRRDLTAECRRGIFRLVTATEEISPVVPLNGRASFVYHGKHVTASMNNSNIENKLLLFRSRREGDRFTFRRRGITKTLGKALRELNIPASARDELLCLCEGHTVLWCECLGYSEQGRNYTENQKLTIELTEEMCYDTAQGH